MQDLELWRGGALRREEEPRAGAGAPDKESAGRLPSTAAPAPRQDALSLAKITAFSSNAPDLVHPRKDNLNIRYWGRGSLVVLWEGAGVGSVRYEEDSGFLLRGMGWSPEKEQWVPGLPSPSTPPQALQRLGIAASLEPLGIFRAVSAPIWFPEASPHMTFLGFWGLAWGDCSHRGRARQPMGCSSSVSRVEPAVQLLARFGVS